jgi:trimeric autotransporter adhesin
VRATFSTTPTMPYGRYTGALIYDLAGRTGTLPVTLTVPSSGPTLATLSGQVSLQGRPTPPSPRWSIGLTVTMQLSGSQSFAVSSDTSGRFTVTNLAPGTYDIGVKGAHTLRTRVRATLAAGANAVSIGTLQEGDVNGDNCVSLLDFSALSRSYGLCAGDAGYDARADLNGDGCITLLDFSLLSRGYGQCGAAP